jgi:hypothetical protein
MAPQSYYMGGKIRASDFNNFADDINEIVGLGAGDSGYGQDHLMVSYVSAGARIRVANWDELLTSLKFAAQHQGTTISSPTSTSDPAFPVLRDTVKIIPTLIDDIANVRANKLNYDISKMSIDANKISSSKTFVAPSEGSTAQNDNTWISDKNYSFSVNFADANARRNFFNAGGEIRISCELSNHDSSHQQSDSWATMLDSISVVRFGFNETISNSETNTGSGTRNGFRQLFGEDGAANEWEPVVTEFDEANPFYKKTGTQGYYSGNQINMYVKLVGDTGLAFNIVFGDQYPVVYDDPDTLLDESIDPSDSQEDDPNTSYDDTKNNWTSGWDSSISADQPHLSDYVDGTLSVTIDQQRADDNDPSNLGVVSPSPTYSHISEL